MICYPIEKMIADHNTKPLVGGKFKMFRGVILNLSEIHHDQVGQQECVEQTRAQMTQHGTICACYAIVSHDACLYRGLTHARVCTMCA